MAIIGISPTVDVIFKEIVVDVRVRDEAGCDYQIEILVPKGLNLQVLLIA